jgi:hypothetical protein
MKFRELALGVTGSFGIPLELVIGLAGKLCDSGYTVLLSDRSRETFHVDLTSKRRPGKAAFPIAYSLLGFKHHPISPKS